MLWKCALIWAHFNTMGCTVILLDGLEPEAHEGEHVRTSGYFFLTMLVRKEYMCGAPASLQPLLVSACCFSAAL